MKVYHYTSIETLALILKNKSIRFNRLDNVDDLEESIYGSGFQNIKLAKYTFVSCWTRDKEENLALWNMYTQNKGVRIGLEENPFVAYPVNDKFKSYFKTPLEFGPDYLALSFTNEIKLHDIIYVDNQCKKIKSLIQNNKDNITIKTNDVGLYKDLRWQFQKESRYKIILNPVNLDITNQMKGESGNPVFDMVYGLFSSLVPSLFTETPIKESELFIKLNEAAINNIEVMMGPETSDHDKLLVEELLSDYPQHSLKDSYFRGKIKSRK